MAVSSPIFFRRANYTRTRRLWTRSKCIRCCCKMISSTSATNIRSISRPIVHWGTIVRILFPFSTEPANWCSNPSIVVGLPKLTDHQLVQEIAAKHGSKTTPAQVLIAWGAYRGFSVIPKSVLEGKFPFPIMILDLLHCFRHAYNMWWMELRKSRWLIPFFCLFRTHPVELRTSRIKQRWIWKTQCHWEEQAQVLS